MYACAFVYSVPVCLLGVCVCVCACVCVSVRFCLYVVGGALVRASRMRVHVMCLYVHRCARGVQDGMAKIH